MTDQIEDGPEGVKLRLTCTGTDNNLHTICLPLGAAQVDLVTLFLSIARDGAEKK